MSGFVADSGRPDGRPTIVMANYSTSPAIEAERMLTNVEP